MQEAAKGKSSEIIVSELVDGLPLGLKDSNGFEYGTPPRYEVYVYPPRNEDGRTLFKVKLSLGVGNVETIEIPWKKSFEHSPVDLDRVAGFARGDERPNIFDGEWNIGSIRRAIDTEIEETSWPEGSLSQELDRLYPPLHLSKPSKDPFYDRANIGSSTRIHAILQTLIFFMNIRRPVVVENGTWDSIGVMIAARMSTQTVVYWKEKNEERKGIPRRLPAGYRELGLDENPGAHFSIWNFPDHDVLERGLDYLGRDLVDGGILMIQTERPLDLWFKADTPGWRVLYHRDMPKSDYVLPSPLIREFWMRSQSPTRPTRFHFLILQRVNSK